MSTPRRTVGFNFLEEPELPAPQVTEAQAEADRRGALRPAGPGEVAWQPTRTATSSIHGETDEILGVLKIANPAFNATELEAQDAAADLIADAEPSLRIAVPLPNVAGEKCTAITGLLEGTAYVRLLRFLPGGTLYRVRVPAAGRGRGAGRDGRTGQPGTRRFRPSRSGPRAAVGSPLRRRRCGGTDFACR